MWRSVWQRELAIKAAASADWLYPLVFFVLVLVLFPIAFGTEKALLASIAVPAVWVAALFSILLASSTFFTEDIHNGTLEQIMASPMSVTLWVMIKLGVHWLTSGFVLVLASFLVVPLYGVAYSQAVVLMLSLLIGTPILLLLAALAAVLSESLPVANVLVPVIALPLQLPVLIFAMGLLAAHEQHLPMLPLVALLVAMLLMAIMLIPYTIAVVLKWVV